MWGKLIWLYNKLKKEKSKQGCYAEQWDDMMYVQNFKLFLFLLWPDIVIEKTIKI